MKAILVFLLFLMYQVPFAQVGYMQSIDFSEDDFFHVVAVGTHSTDEVRVAAGAANYVPGGIGIYPSDPLIAVVDVNGQIIDHEIFKVPGGGEITGVTVNPDETITAFGNNYNTGWYSWFVLHLDSNLDTLWTRFYHHLAGRSAGKIERFSDGSFVLAGTTSVSGMNDDLCILRIDGAGHVLWVKHFLSGEDDRAMSLTTCSNGDVVIVGGQYNQFWEGEVVAIRVDENGDVVWNKVLDTSEYDDVTDVVELNDGSIMIAGYQRSPANGFNSATCIKLDFNGNVIWSNMYSSGYVDEANSILVKQNGSLVLTGRRIPLGGQDYEVLAIELDTGGNLQWGKTYAEANYYLRSADAVLSDDGILMAGSALRTNNGAIDALLMQTDSLGWNCNAADITSLFAKYDNPLAPLNPLSEFVGISTWKGTVSDTLQMPIMNVFCGSVAIAKEKEIAIMNVYPNPATDVLNIEFENSTNAVVELLSIDGRLISSKSLNGERKTTLALNELASGMYLISVRIGEKRFVQKVLKH